MRKIKLITIVSLMLLSLFLGGCFAAITVTTQGFDPHKLDSNTDPTIIKDGSGQDIITIKLTPGHIVKNDIPLSYQYHRDYLYEEADSLGISTSSIANVGLTVYTSMNPTLQEAAYNIYQDWRYFPEDMSGQMVQSGAAFMDPKTGGIEAIIGGRGTYVSRGLDHATQIHRSPGSSIKPTKRKG